MAYRFRDKLKEALAKDPALLVTQNTGPTSGISYKHSTTHVITRESFYKNEYAAACGSSLSNDGTYIDYHTKNPLLLCGKCRKYHLQKYLSIMEAYFIREDLKKAKEKQEAKDKVEARERQEGGRAAVYTYLKNIAIANNLIVAEYPKDSTMLIQEENSYIAVYLDTEDMVMLGKLRDGTHVLTLTEDVR